MKKLTQEILDQLTEYQKKVFVWNDDISSLEHLNFLIAAGEQVPQFLLDYLNTAEEVLEPITVSSDGDPITYDEALANASYIPKFGEEAFYNPEINRWVAKQLSFEGGGVNSTNSTGWTKRFNGAIMSNITAPMTEFGILVHCLEVTSDIDRKGRSVMITHSNPEGGGMIVMKTILVNKYNNQFGSDNNMKLFIPGGRRIAFWLEAGPSDRRFSVPQMRISYRRVLSND